MTDTANSTPALRTTARWFDGHRTQRRTVIASLGAAGLQIDTVEGALITRYAIGKLQLSPPWRHAPLAVNLPDAGTLWIAAHDRVFHTELHRRAGSPGVIDRAIAFWPTVLLATLCLIALVLWFDRQGAAQAGALALKITPIEIDDALGRRVLAQVQRTELEPSRLPLARQRLLQQRFAQASAAVAPQLKLRLYFHGSKGRSQLNAFALPGGSVVLFDGLAELLTDDELMAVLGHEAGHVLHRHGMRRLAELLGLTTVAGVVLGDFSTLASTLVGVLQTLRYGRDAEREADQFILQFLAAAGVPASAEARMWERFADEVKRVSGGAELPAWLSTHPGMDERIKAAQQRP